MAGRKIKLYYCPFCHHVAKRVGYSTYFTCTNCNARLVQKCGVLQETRAYTPQQQVSEGVERVYMSADEYESLVG